MSWEQVSVFVSMEINVWLQTTAIQKAGRTQTEVERGLGECLLS